MRRSHARTWVLDSLFFFLLAAALIWPLFKVKYLDRWESIESTFIADARFLRDHWPHPLWQPFWYGGTRTDYVYPPALRYGTAGLTKLYPPLLPVRAYHIYTAFFYCVGMAGVYLLARSGSGSRGAACWAAAATAVLSPALLLMPLYREDSGYGAPMRLWVLTRYGEGPHMTALALIPLALAAAIRGLPAARPGALAVAALLSALVVSNNFYGATALALLFPLLTWTLWATHRNSRIWWRALGVAGLAYGLTAFWLTPSYLRLTIRNLQFVADPGTAWSRWVFLAAAAVVAAVSYRLARGRPERAYLVFLCGATALLALNVLGNHYFEFRVTGEPARLVPELDLAILLLAAEGLRRLWERPGFARRAVLVLALLPFAGGVRYLSHPWRTFPRYPAFEDRIEYRLTEWIAQHLPEARVLAVGSARFWYNTWRDLAQMDGGSDQGILNPWVIRAQYQILYGEFPDAAIWFMQIFGVDAAIVPDEGSGIFFHDYTYPKKFAGVLPVLYDDRQGTRIYGVPRRFPGLARVVEKAKVEALRPLQHQDDFENIRPVADLVERGPDVPVRTAWEGTDVLRAQASVKAGELLLVQVSYDPAWRAYAGGQALPVRPDLLGQMLIEAPPGDHDIRLVFELPFENRVGRIASALSGAVVIGLALLGRRRQEAAV